MLSKKLLDYYQKELHFLRKQGKRFAQTFPGLGRRLGMSSDETADPHVERIIESFAFLTSRIHQRLDEDLPEMTQALLSVLAPHFLRTFPSVCIVHFQPDEKASGLTAPYCIKAGTVLQSQTESEHSVMFRTVSDVTCLPVTLELARLQYDEEGWFLDLQFRGWSGAWVKEQNLSLWINGSLPFVNALYSLLCSQVRSVSLRAGEQWHILPDNSIQGAASKKCDLLRGNNIRLQLAYDLITDFYVFPQHFYFIEIKNTPSVDFSGEKTFSYHIRFQKTCDLENLSTLVNTDTFRLNCTSAVNLFTQRAEPITPSPSITEYPIVPDLRRGHRVEVWSVDTVNALRKNTEDTRPQRLPPLYGLGLDQRDNTNKQSDVSWHHIQRSQIRMDTTTALLHTIAFCDRGTRPLSPEYDVLIPELTCTNGSLPVMMKQGQPEGDFTCQLTLAGIRVSALTRPTPPVMPLNENSRLWALVSQLSLTHMSLSGPDGVRVLRKTLATFNIADSHRVTYLINLIDDVTVSAISLRQATYDPFSLTRGLQILIQFSEDALACEEYFLFCCILERFMALYAPVNSFTRVTTQITGRKETCRHWPIRSGRVEWL